MTDIFERGDCVWFTEKSLRGMHLTVIHDAEQETLLADTQGRVFEAEVGTESIYLTERDGLLGRTVECSDIHFQ